MRTQDLRGSRTIEDLGPLRTQDLKGSRTIEDPGPLRTHDPKGPRTLEDLFCLKSKCIIKQNDDRIDSYIENKKVLWYIVFISKKDI